MKNNPAIGQSWEEFEKEVFSQEEIEASKVRVAIMSELILARNERGISQKKLEEMTGVRQPVIARMETGVTSPRLDTVLKVLYSLGKTLQVVDIEQG
jgi:predicted transcriptional regulator